MSFPTSLFLPHHPTYLSGLICCQRDVSTAGTITASTIMTEGMRWRTRESNSIRAMFFFFLSIAHPEPRGAFDTHVHTALAWSYSHCIFDQIGFSLRGKAYVPFGIWKHEKRWLSQSNLVLFRPLPVRLSISRWRARRREMGEILHGGSSERTEGRGRQHGRHVWKKGQSWTRRLGAGAYTRPMWARGQARRGCSAAAIASLKRV